MDITKWLEEQECDLLHMIDDWFESKDGKEDIEMVHKNWYDITETARKEGYSTKVRPTENGTELVCSRDRENAPGKEEKRYPVLGISLRADAVIADLKQKPKEK